MTPDRRSLIFHLKKPHLGPDSAFIEVDFALAEMFKFETDFAQWAKYKMTLKLE
jgi:hypothetical protein